MSRTRAPGSTTSACTGESALAHHAVWACITLISCDIGKLRPKLVEQDDDGIWSEFESPAFSPVLRKPNDFQNYIQFKEHWALSKLDPRQHVRAEAARCSAASWSRCTCSIRAA